MNLRALVHFHEDIMNLQFGLMMNNKMEMASGQSRLLGFADWKQCQKSEFLQIELTWKSVQMDLSRCEN